MMCDIDECSYVMCEECSHVICDIDMSVVM